MYRRMALAVVVGAVLAVLLGGVAGAGEQSFDDDFDRFVASRWTKGEHRLGRSVLRPENVTVREGRLRIKLPAHTLDGGEVSTRDLHRYGSYRARMKLPDAPTSITGFFLYKSPDYESEIDIELFNDSSRRIMFTTYAGGSQTHNRTMLLPFDPTAGFHTYRFDYAPHSVRFYAGGQLMKEWKSGIPQTSMYLMVNSWFPAWLEGGKPRTDRYLYVDWIQYNSR